MATISNFKMGKNLSPEDKEKLKDVFPIKEQNKGD